MKSSEYIIPIYIEGTKDNSIFSYKNEKENKVNLTKEYVENQINKYLSGIDDDSYYKEVFFYGGKFIELEESLQEEIMQLLDEYVKKR